MGDSASAEESLGDRLKALRRSAQRSQDEVADAVDVNSGTYSRWERDVVMPHAGQIVQLARYFGCTTDYLLLGGTLKEDDTSLELHRFLATKWGRYAQKRNLVGMLRAIRITPDGQPPSIKSYTRFVKYYWQNEDDDALDGEFDDALDDD